jgi:hypothetical protein
MVAGRQSKGYGSLDKPLFGRFANAHGHLADLLDAT